MNYKFNGEYERQDAINIEIVETLHNYRKMLGLLILVGIAIAYPAKITYFPSFEFVLLILFAVLIMYPAALYLALALHAEVGYKKYPLRHIEASVDNESISMKTNLYQAEVSLSDIKRIVSSRRYMLVFVTHGKKVGLFIFKRDWLISGDDWEIFKSFMRDKLDTK